MQADDSGMMQGASEGDASQDARALRWALGVIVLFCVLMLALWTQREPLAENYLAREFARLGIPARYHLANIGFRTQRIENVVLGRASDPDLTADWAEVDIAFSGLTPHVAAVRAGGVRLHGRLHDGILSLGSLDALRDPKSTAPFRFPDIHMGLTDARMRLDTDFGPVGLKLDGAGNLRSGFRGQLAAVMPRLDVTRCRAERATAYVSLSLRDERPNIAGPLRVAALRCERGKMLMRNPRMQIDVTSSSQLDRWTGEGGIAADRFSMGDSKGDAIRGRLGFDGNLTGARGRIHLTTGSLVSSGAVASSSEMSGAWTFAPGRSRIDGKLAINTLRTNSADPLQGMRGAGEGTPVGPLATRIADAIRAASVDNRLNLRFAVAQRGESGTVALTGISFSSRSGVHAGLGPGGHFLYAWPTGQWALEGGFATEGGGLPRAGLRLTQRAGGGFGGQAFIDPYMAGTARLELDIVRFRAGPGGETQIQTEFRIDGPLANGNVRALTLPIEAVIARDGSIAVNRRCVPLGFRSLTVSGLALDATQLTLCPTDGSLLSADHRGARAGGTISGANLSGRLGRNPFRFSTRSVSFSTARNGISLQGADVAIGPADSPIHLTANSLNAVINGAGVAGTLVGGAARIGAVPLRVENVTGRWSFADAKLRLDAGLTVADTAPSARFEPLASRDFALTLHDNRIAAAGALLEPTTGMAIARVNLSHDLNAGRGEADLTVPGITFTSALQPEMLSKLAKGVVANVRGTVTGGGHIGWIGDKISSDGAFRSDSLDLAAAFGPVTGLSGEIRFTDLVNLITAPGQVVRLATVNPGTAVSDGVVTYQLIAGQRINIENGRWPFAGGTLELLPTTLDFSAAAARHLSFRVVGLDAGAFIQTLELDNISATGTFDGLLPMVFDANGGRIVGGLLVARQNGSPPLILNDARGAPLSCDPARQAGTLAYVGPVSNEQVGVYGKMAFDALKNLQYKCLTIMMDGALDGEVVTQVAFNGVNRSPLGSVPAGIARKFVGLPFQFDIRISAPFRGLLNTAQSFADPSLFIGNNLGKPDAAVPQPDAKAVAVQPPESDKGVTKEPK